MYQNAAQTLRIPYWDWAINPTMPALVSNVTVTVNGPKGLQNIANPLYNYTFHPLPGPPDFPSGDGVRENPCLSALLPFLDTYKLMILQLSTYKSTVRYPNTTTQQSQPLLVNQQLTANAQACASLLHYIRPS